MNKIPRKAILDMLFYVGLGLVLGTIVGHIGMSLFGLMSIETVLTGILQMLAGLTLMVTGLWFREKR